MAFPIRIMCFFFLCVFPFYSSSGEEPSQNLCENDLQPSPRLTLSMIIRDEADSYLRAVLEDARHYITDAVIVDDGSVDNSVEVCREVLKGIPLTIIQNGTSKFHNEWTLRQQQWDETVKTNPDWILSIDADHIFEEKFKTEVKRLIACPDIDAVHFRLYDFWSPTHYRDDNLWYAHKTCRCFLMRYKPGMTYTFQKTAQHCGHFPVEVYSYPRQAFSPLRLKHFGWAKEEDRRKKYARYQMLDPDGKYGSREQYASVLDPHPHLVLWQENEEPTSTKEEKPS